jgi:hypothetical protein
LEHIGAAGAANPALEEVLQLLCLAVLVARQLQQELPLRVAAVG